MANSLGAEISHEPTEAATFRELAVRRARAGDLADAKSIADRILYVPSRAAAYGQFALIEARRTHFAEAKRLADRIENGRQPEAAAAAMAGAGHPTLNTRTKRYTGPPRITLRPTPFDDPNAGRFDGIPRSARPKSEGGGTCKCGEAGQAGGLSPAPFDRLRRAPQETARGRGGQLKSRSRRASSTRR